MSYRLIAVITALGTCLAMAKSAGDTVSQPKRTFGLGDATVVSASPDLQYIAAGGQGGAYLWDVQSGKLRHRLQLDWWATALACSPVSNIVAVASKQRLFLFDTETGKQTAELQGHDGDIYRLQFSADGQLLISASADNTARIWSMETGLQMRQVRTPGSPITDAALSLDGRKLATVDTFLTNCVKIWDLETETE